MSSGGGGGGGGGGHSERPQRNTGRATAEWERRNCAVAVLGGGGPEASGMPRV